MPKLLLPTLLATVLLFALGACSSRKQKSSAHIYPGDGPSIKFSDKPETAGGNIQAY